MAVDRELRRLLARALLPGPAAVPASEILAQLQRAQRQPDVNVAELLALAAEAALHQHDFGAAQCAVDWFLHDCRAKNQFYCRVQLVRAHCASRAAADTTGGSRLRRVLDALRFVLLVLPVACDARRRPHYDFLVYNASVAYWRIARQLMKRATWQFLAPSLTRVLDALKAVGERDALWVARLQLALVSALLDAKQFAEAAKAASELVDVQLAPLVATAAPSEELSVLLDAALRAQVHVGSMKDAECQKLLASAKKSATSKRAALLVKLQSVRSGGASTAAYSEILQDATGFAAFSATATSDAELSRFLDTLGAASVEAIDADVVVETGLHAASARELRTASCCDRVLLRKGKSLAPRHRVLHQVLRAVLLAAAPPAPRSWTDSRATREALELARRVEAVKAVERAILAAKRQADADLVESVCVHAWNLSLPLLQPHLRGQLSRVFALATDALEAADSLLLELRARLLLEMAKQEVASEFLSKAYASVSKALALDYGASVAHAKTLDEVRAHESKLSTRPVDIHLRELRKLLQWRLDMDEPADEGGAAPEDPVRALVEQARGTRDTAALRAALTRAVALLVELTEQRAAPERLVALWLDVSKLLKEKLRDVSSAEQFAKRGLEIFFSAGSGSSAPTAYELSPESSMRTEKSLVVLEIEFRALLVESLAARLKTRADEIDAAKKRQLEATRRGGHRDAARQHSAPLDELELAALALLPGESVVLGVQQPLKTELASGDEKDAEAIRTRARGVADELLELKRELLGHLAASLAVAGHLGWRFTLENTCVYLWNYHFHLFRMLASSSASSFSVEWILRECVAAFEAAYTALEAFAGVDGELLVCTALGLAAVYERSAQWDKALGIADAFLKRKAGSDSSAVSAVRLMRFAELKTRAQLALNAKEVTPGESAGAFLRAAANLEALESASRQQQSISAAGQSFFQKAVALWPPAAAEMVAPLLSGDQDAAPSLTMEEVQQRVEIYAELWTRLGHGALRMQQFRFVVECSNQALAVLELSSGSSRRRRVPPLTTGTWRWLAVSEILCGRAILALGSGESTPKKLVLGALQHLVNAVEYGDRADSGPLVAKAGDVVWNAALVAFDSTQAAASKEYDAADVKRVIEALRVVLVRLGKVATEASGSPSRFGDLVLLALAVCENAGEWAEARGICEDALASKAGVSISTTTLNEIRTAAAISAAKLGTALVGGAAGSSSGSGSRTAEEQSPILRAKILKKIALSSAKHPLAQLKALASAYAALEGKPEEQAVLLIDMAEWFYTSRTSAQDMGAYLDSAAKILLASESSSSPSSQALSHPCSELTSPSDGSGRLTVSGSAPVVKQEPDELAYSALWRNEKLLRVFVVQAMAASCFLDRWSYIEKALHCVQRAWEGIVSIANTADLQERFAKVPGSSELDFDAWKRAEEPRHVAPESSREWVVFYLRSAKSTDARFCTQWVEKLQAMRTSAPTTLHFTDPVATGFYLERLLAMLRAQRLDELALPVICLYQVVFHGYAPTQAHTMRLWLELTLFDILERTNLAACALPMQSALEIFQEHGAAIIDELRLQPTSSADHISKGVCRRVLPSTSPDLLEKMRSCVRMLVRFGYVRQGKTGLEILRRVAEHSGSTPASESELHVLSALVLDMEGSGGAAAAEIAAALRESPTLGLRELVQWTIQYCELTPAPADCVARLQIAEQLVAKWLVSQASPDGGSAAPQGGVGDLELLLWLAQLKFTRAMQLMDGVGDLESRNGGSEASAPSRQALSESEQILSYIGAKPILGQYLARYSDALLSRRPGVTSTTPAASDVACATVKLEQALVELTAVRSRVRQFGAWRVPASGDGDSEVAAFRTPLDSDILRAKSLLASVELAAETSSAAVVEHEMTFYVHEADAQRNVVDKWLSETSPEAKAAVGGDLGLALVLLAPERAAPPTSALDGSDESLAVAALQWLQCQRLARFHGTDRPRVRRIRDALWTCFTSPENAHATWICGSNASESAAAAAPDSQLAAADAEAAAAPAAAQLRDENDELDAFLSDYARQMLGLQKLALEKRCFALLRGCSLELVQVTGCRRPLECIRSLLVYQSVVVRGHLRELFERCAAPRDVQQLHLRRVEKLQLEHANAARHSAPHELSLLFLEQQSTAFKRISVAAAPELILAALPPLARVLSLLLSPDKRFLYCAVVGSGEKQFALARMECTEAVLARLALLQERVQRWRAASAQLLAEAEELHSKESDFEFAATDALGLSASDDELEREFSAIAADTAELFAPLLSHAALHAVLQSELPGAALTLLVDRELASLPLEALPALEKADSIARDLSLHVLFQRLQAQKARPLKRDDVRVIVDPHREDPGLEGQTMESVVQQHVKRPGAAFATWRDAVEHGQPPTPTDWQHALLGRRGGGLVFVGAGRVLGSAVSPSALLAMSPALSCQVVCLLDRAENAASARRQSKADSEKSARQLALECDEYANAALWSLAGVNVLVLNQWPTTFNGNRRLASALLGGLARGLSVGKALKKYGEQVAPSGAMAATAPSSTASSVASLPPASSSATPLPPADAGAAGSSAAKLLPAGVKTAGSEAGAKGGGKLRLKHRVRFNTVVYGLAHMALKSSDA